MSSSKCSNSIQERSASSSKPPLSPTRSAPPLRLYRRGSYHAPRGQQEAAISGGGGGGDLRRNYGGLSPRRKGGSFRVTRTCEPVVDFNEKDRFLPVPPVNIRVADLGDDEEDDEEEEHREASKGQDNGAALEDAGMDVISPGGRRRSIQRLEFDEQQQQHLHHQQQQQQQQQRRHQHQYDDRGSSPDYSPCYSPTSPWDPKGPTVQWPQHQHQQQQQQHHHHQYGVVPELSLHAAETQRRRSSTMHQFDPPRQHPPLDQFDEFVYKSQHMASAGPGPGGGLMPSYPPPEVNIEVPSDSDSSRRPSKASFGTHSNASSCVQLDQVSPRNSIHGIPRSPGAPMGPNTFMAGRRGSSAGVEVPAYNPVSSPRRESKSVINTQMMGQHHNLLAARPNLDRRSSHTGVLHTRTRNSRSGVASPKGGGGGGYSPAGANMLGVPRRRSRGVSLPGSNFELNQEDIYRLRNFSMEGRKVINRGDSLKARSNHSINSTGSRYRSF